MSPKNELQEFAQKNGIEFPVYSCERVGGYDHAPTWKCTVRFNDHSYISSVHSTKRAAEHEAASKMLELVNKSNVKTIPNHLNRAEEKIRNLKFNNEISESIVKAVSGRHIPLNSRAEPGIISFHKKRPVITASDQTIIIINADIAINFLRQLEEIYPIAGFNVYVVSSNTDVQNSVGASKLAKNNNITTVPAPKHCVNAAISLISGSMIASAPRILIISRGLEDIVDCMHNWVTTGNENHKLFENAQELYEYLSAF